MKTLRLLTHPTFKRVKLLNPRKQNLVENILFGMKRKKSKSSGKLPAVEATVSALQLNSDVAKNWRENIWKLNEYFPPDD